MENRKKVEMVFPEGIYSFLLRLSKKENVPVPEKVCSIIAKYQNRIECGDCRKCIDVPFDMFNEIELLAKDGRRRISDQAAYLLELGIEEYRLMGLSHEEGQYRAKALKRRLCDYQVSG